MLPFKLGPNSFQIPSHYGELTFKQFYAIRKNTGDLLDLFSILSGLDREVWEQTKDLNIDAKIAPYLEWMKKPFEPDQFIKPDRLEIAGKYYEAPKDIRFKTYGQKLALETEVNRVSAEKGTDVDLFAYALALYFQPIYFKEANDNKLVYKSEQVDELLPLVMECKLEEGYPIAAFFLSNYLKSLLSNETSFHTILHRRKLEQVSTNSISSGNLQRFTPWRRVLIRLTNKFTKCLIRTYSQRSTLKKNKQLSKGDLLKK